MLEAGWDRGYGNNLEHSMQLCGGEEQMGQCPSLLKHQAHHNTTPFARRLIGLKLVIEAPPHSNDFPVGSCSDAGVLLLFSEYSGAVSQGLPGVSLRVVFCTVDISGILAYSRGIRTGEEVARYQH